VYSTLVGVRRPHLAHVTGRCDDAEPPAALRKNGRTSDAECLPDPGRSGRERRIPPEGAVTAVTRPTGGPSTSKVAEPDDPVRRGEETREDPAWEEGAHRNHRERFPGDGGGLDATGRIDFFGGVRAGLGHERALATTILPDDRAFTVRRCRAFVRVAAVRHEVRV
jgi:hypothetical protein